MKKLFYSILLLLFLVPLMQNAFSIFSVRELGGDFTEEETNVVDLSLENYNKEEFQRSFEEYWNNSFGLKNFLIRINNQFNYSFFNLTNASDVIVGRSNILFPESYIRSYYGEDFIGNEKIKQFVLKAKFIQDSLATQNKFFFLLINPGKAFIYPENIPEKYKSLYSNSKNNYEVLISEAKKNGVNVLNMTNYILTQKDSFNYPIFPKQGVHWSGNTVAHVSDTLLKYISKYSGHKIAKIELHPGETLSDSFRYTDYDIGEAMNLLWNISDENLHYPKISYVDQPNVRPTLLGVGDSFFQSFYGFYPIFDSVFSNNSQVWYYNKLIDWPKRLQDYYIKPQWLDLKTEVNKSDIIILEMTDENIKYEGYSFLDNLEKLFKGGYEVKEEMRSLFNEISEKESIIEQAKNLHDKVGYSEEQMKNALAKNLLNNQWLLNFDYDKEIENMVQYIKSDEKWLNSIKEKAIRNNIPLEEAIRNDAIWSINQKLSQN